MAYSTGTVNSYSDLLTKLKALAEAQGWVSASYAENDELRLQSAAGDQFYTFKRISNDTLGNLVSYPYSTYGECIAILGSTSFSSGAAWNAQPGNSRDNGVLTSVVTLLRIGTTGPWVKYHAFVTATYIHMVVEIVTGMFGHLMVGILDKQGLSYSGGQYVAASFLPIPPTPDVTTSAANANGIAAPYVSYPFTTAYPYYTTTKMHLTGIDSEAANAWQSSGNPSNAGQGQIYGMGGLTGYTGYGFMHPEALYIAGTPNSIDASTMLLPHRVYYSGAQSRLRFVGQVPDQFVCDMSYLTAGDIVTFGDDEYMVFPTYRKGPSINDDNYSAQNPINTYYPYNTSFGAAFAFKVS